MPAIIDGPSPSQESQPLATHLSASRSKAITRAITRLFIGAILGAPAVMIYRTLDFGSVGISSRMVTWSIAAIAVPLACGSICAIAVSVRWLLLTLWPSWIGVDVSDQEIVIRLGPFGQQRYMTDELDVRYPYELSADIDDGVFEALLPEDVQHATFVPRLNHPDASKLINDTIVRFCSGTEAELASDMKPVVDLWRSRSSIGDTPEAEASE